MSRLRLKGLTRAVAAAVFVAGCGDAEPARVTVTGTVSENSEPLADASVMFAPSGAGPERPAEGKTGPRGDFELMTGSRSGIIPGKYHVVVTKGLPPMSSDMAKRYEDDPFMANLSNLPPTSKKKRAQPTEFSFDREVTAESKQVFNFDIKSDGTSGAKKSAK